MIVDGQIVEAKKGNFIVFPSDKVHSVKPLISEERNAVLFRFYHLSDS